ncbi:MAG: GGDEF domain-containing protein [Candidatus Omnitrophota bacterium]|nr:MAG: GGDEF domain-containing protein [Candidatus Omnitrophota bacterium]
MHILNFLIIPIIVVSLFCGIKFAYIVSMVCSVFAAFFIYAHQSLANILLTIAIFNLTPLICRQFDLTWRRKRASLGDRLQRARLVCENMQKEADAIRQSNFRLNEEAFHTAELYKITRDMSAVPEAGDAFSIFTRKLMEVFRFKGCRLILTDEDTEGFEVEKVFELKYPLHQANSIGTEASDAQILKEGFKLQKIRYSQDSTLVPLTAENRFLGALRLEGLPQDKQETFCTLANQFSLAMKRVKLYEKMQKLAINDGLTGLFVRRYILQRLAEEIERGTRHHLHLAFLMIDIDYFKRCNDRFGHLTGDAVLKEMAQVIKSSVREIDLVARFGGEEFSVLLPDTDKASAARVAERIRSSVERHLFRAYNETVKITVSIGVAAFPEDSHLLQQLVDKSDQALYRAKLEGRNRVEIF